MDSRQLILNYESLRQLTDRMRIAADREEWDQLIALEQQRALCIAAIQTLADYPHSTEVARQLDELISAILGNEAKIRQLTQNRMVQLKGIMQSNLQEQRLNQAYGR